MGRNSTSSISSMCRLKLRFRRRAAATLKSFSLLQWVSNSTKVLVRNCTWTVIFAQYRRIESRAAQESLYCYSSSILAQYYWDYYWEYFGRARGEARGNRMKSSVLWQYRTNNRQYYDFYWYNRYWYNRDRDVLNQTKRKHSFHGSTIVTHETGTKSTLLIRRSRDNSREGFRQWPFMSVHFWGELSYGNWTLEIRNAGQFGGQSQSTYHLTTLPLFFHSSFIWYLSYFSFSFIQCLTFSSIAGYKWIS